jgi:hypothetical protein
MAKDTSITDISLRDLVFDPKNPRLSPEVNRSSEQSIIEYMLREANLLELMQSIFENGYFDSEPLLVAPAKNGQFIVVEGNRRLAALKLLENPGLSRVKQNSINEIISSKKWSIEKIPCIVHKKRDDILNYLGYRHITGVKSWGPLEKARYLQQLFEKNKRKGGSTEDNYKTLAKMIGSRATHVGRLLGSLKLYDLANDKSYFNIKIDPSEIDFSILYTAVGFKHIHQHIGLETPGDIDEKKINWKNFEFVFKCLYGPTKKIKDSREIADLNSVIGEPRALRELENGTPLEEAKFYTDGPIEAFYILLDKATNLLRSARNCWDKLADTGNDTDTALKKAQEIENIAKSIRKTIEKEND